jgi:hypothetical protein
MGLEYVEFFMDVERAFGITIPDSEERTLRSIGDVYRCISRHQTGVEPTGPPPAEDDRWRRLAEILQAVPGVRAEHIRWDTDLYRDLALGG